MKRLHLIFDKEEGNVAERLRCLTQVASSMDVQVVKHPGSTFSNDVALPGEGIFRISRNAKFKEIELLKEGVVSFYSDPAIGCLGWNNDSVCWTIVFCRQGLSCPKTVAGFGTDRQAISHAVEVLGGYPIVIKVSNGTIGYGVLLAESQSALFAIVDYLTQANVAYVLQEYVPHSRALRLFVVGRTVARALWRSLPPGDFRSNAWRDEATRFDGFQDIDVKDVPAHVATESFEALSLAGVECGALDFAEGPGGTLRLLELNFPFGIMPNDYEVCHALIRHLVDKSHDR